MIQDIAPSRLDNSYKNRALKSGDIVLAFDKEGKLIADVSDGSLVFPDTSYGDHKTQYLFSVDETGYFLLMDDDPDSIFSGAEHLAIRQVRDMCSGKELFAAFTAYHLWKWYDDNRYCGTCGEPLSPDDTERALKCGNCGRIVYPRINPAVIVGVINGDSLLITRYRRGYAHNALVAGFAEIGETLEETVAREVMEETGLHVANIRYYKSQPWGMAQDLLTGFFCDVTGDDTIRMDEGELKYAEWTKRDEIELQPNNLSLTNEMMRMFKENRIR
ncbi:MAG: NAD(+) diphosphatase [Lachnospiraceae bacterium]|nr:NAD(+) diphosphatase [Lachnospiraceae bacterium]